MASHPTLPLVCIGTESGTHFKIPSYLMVRDIRSGKTHEVIAGDDERRANGAIWCVGFTSLGDLYWSGNRFAIRRESGKIATWHPTPSGQIPQALGIQATVGCVLSTKRGFICLDNTTAITRRVDRTVKKLEN